MKSSRQGLLRAALAARAQHSAPSAGSALLPFLYEVLVSHFMGPDFQPRSSWWLASQQERGRISDARSFLKQPLPNAAAEEKLLGWQFFRQLSTGIRHLPLSSCDSARKKEAGTLKQKPPPR